jgi:capsular exopolysaccharide synthesis family protein
VDYAIDTPMDKRDSAPDTSGRGRTADPAGGAWPVDARYSIAAPGLFDYLRIIYRHRWKAIAALLIVSVPVGLYGFLQQPAYEARVRLVLDPEPSVPVAFEDASRRQGLGPDTRTQEEVLRSREVVYRTIAALRLWERPEAAALTAPSTFSRMKQWVGLEPASANAAPAPRAAVASPATPNAAALPTGAGPTAAGLSPVGLSAAGTAAGTATPGLTPDAPAPSAAAASATAAALVASTAAFSSTSPVDPRAEALIGLLTQRITVNAIPLSRLVDVIVEAPDPKLAADFANELAQQFIKQDIEARVLASRQSSAWLEARLDEQRRKVEADDLALQQYKEQQDALSVEDRQNIVVQRLSDLNTAATKARTDRLEKEGTYRQIEQAQTNPAALDNVPAIAVNATIQQYRTQLGDLQRQQLELGQRYGDKHPEMQKIKISIDNTQQRLAAEVAKAADVIKNEYLASVAHESGLARALDMQKGDALRLNRQGLEYGRLQRDADSSRQIYNALLQQARQGDISGEFKQSSVRVIDQARPPFTPVRPQRVKLGALAVATGLFAALGLAFGWEFMDPRIKTPAQIQDYLQLPFVGLVPATKLTEGQDRPQFSQGPPSPFADALRRIRSNLRLSAPGPGPHVLLVTSSAPREGKTTVCVGLSHCFAAAGPRVLLIDADLRRPSVHRTIHVKSRRGLTEYLAGKAELNDVIQQTTFENLSVIPCGSVPENPSELLGLPRMAALLDSVRDRYDWILIDTAPVLSAPDAAQLARLASGILFVVGAEMTSRDEVQRAEQELMRARVPFAGSVLNRAQVEKHGYYYAPYYNKAYESYYSEPGPTN